VAFAEILKALDTLDFNPKSRRDARPILKAASTACIYNGDFSPTIRKYYAFTSDYKNVWFTTSLFDVMPDNLEQHKNMEELQLLIRWLAAQLLGEVREGLREELNI
jgi:hypothetical protein